MGKALGMIDPNTLANAPDRAFAGFPYVVYSRLYDPVTQDFSGTSYLSEHARTIYSELAAGKTVKQAIDKANLDCPPARIDNGRPTKMDMVRRGDQYMRLISVYTGDSANVSLRDGSPANPDYPSHSNYPYVWYRVNP